MRLHPQSLLPQSLHQPEPLVRHAQNRNLYGQDLATQKSAPWRVDRPKHPKRTYAPSWPWLYRPPTARLNLQTGVFRQPSPFTTHLTVRALLGFTPPVDKLLINYNPRSLFSINIHNS